MEEYRIRELLQDGKGRLDLDKYIFYEPYGDRAYDGHEEIVAAKDLRDGIFFETNALIWDLRTSWKDMWVITAPLSPWMLFRRLRLCT